MNKLRFAVVNHYATDSIGVKLSGADSNHFKGDNETFFHQSLSRLLKVKMLCIRTCCERIPRCSSYGKGKVFDIPGRKQTDTIFNIIEDRTVLDKAIRWLVQLPVCIKIFRARSKNQLDRRGIKIPFDDIGIHRSYIVSNDTI